MSAGRTPRALVTGASGFVGQWLAKGMLERGWDVTGAGPGTSFDAPRLGDLQRAVRWVECDVRVTEEVERAVEASRPDVVVHLAGIAFVPGAGKDPGLAAETNVVSTVRLLGVLRQHLQAGTLDPVTIVVGSGEQYGRHDDTDLPLSEEAPQRPHSVYAATKCAQELFALEAHRETGLRVVCTRSFNHSGPGQAPHFLLPALVSRTLALRGKPDPVLLTGNQHTRRDFLHVEDVATAYIALAERGVAGEVYNVASGTGHAVGELARRVLDRAGVGADVRVDPALQRPADVPALVGDSSRLRALGWSPTRDVDAIIDDLIHAASH